LYFKTANGRRVALTDLLGMRMTLDPNRKNPSHRTAAQRGKPSLASPKTRGRNKPEPLATTDQKTQQASLANGLPSRKADHHHKTTTNQTASEVNAETANI
jgi:hypothetical protein